jgi:hypothetical protein
MLSKESILIYKNEEIAVEAFKEYRLSKGIVCKKCGSKEHYWLKPKHQFQCKACRFRTTLRSGTILEGSKLPISYFFITLHLLIKKGTNVTIHDVQQLTEHKYFEPLWDFLRKMKEYVKENEYEDVFFNFIEVANRNLRNGVR